MIFHCNPVIFFKVGLYISKKSIVFFLTFSLFSLFFEDFQPFLIRKQLIMWIIAWRFAPTERRSVSDMSFSLFTPPCHLVLIAAVLAMAVFSFLSRNTVVEIINYLLGWLLYYILVSGVIFCFWEKLEDFIVSMRFSRLQHDQFLQACKWCKCFWAIK